MVFICNTFLTNDDEHLFMCLFTIYVSSLLACLFIFVAYFLIWLFVILNLVILCLFLDISYFIDMCILSIFSFCGLSFDFLVVLFKELLFILIKSNILAIIWFRLFVYYLRNLCLCPKIMKTLSCIFFRSFTIIAFTLGLWSISS